MSRYTSPRLRYLKARLSVLTRPSFLIAAVFLTTVGFVIKEYWTNPNFLKFAENQQDSSTSSNQSPLSEEDKSIAADIDNLPILNYDKQQAQIPITTNIQERDKLKKQNQDQLTKILDLAQKSEAANEIKSNTQSETTNTSSPSAQNPFLAQAENLLKFNGSNQQPAIANNLSPFSSLQLPQTLSNFGINNNTSNQNAASESALKTAINQPNNQSKENSTATTSTNKNFGQISPSTNLPLPTSPTNQGLRQNQSNPLVDTTVFNQPLNTQQQNPYSNFNNQIQYPDNNYNNQLPATNYNQPYDNYNNNQYLNYNQQNPYSNYNNQLPTNNYNQQNPYSNYNNQLPTNNYNQPNLNNQVQSYSNNNTLITGNRYSPEIQTRINNIYDRLNNRNNPTVTPNIYNSPINGVNTNQQPNGQQFNSPYSQQTPVQYPNNGYGY